VRRNHMFVDQIDNPVFAYAIARAHAALRPRIPPAFGIAFCQGGLQGPGPDGTQLRDYAARDEPRRLIRVADLELHLPSSSSEVIVPDRLVQQLWMH
jgi:hypothetical protein